MQNTNDKPDFKGLFQQHLTKYGTDFSKLTSISAEKIQKLYEDYIASKAQFVRRLGEESKIVEITRIFKEDGKFRAVAFLDGRSRIQTVVDIRENDYRLPFLLKDLEFRMKEQLSHIQDLYEVMQEIGAIDESFVGDKDIPVNADASSGTTDSNDVKNKIELTDPNETIDVAPISPIQVESAAEVVKAPSYEKCKQECQNDADLLGDCAGASLDAAILSQYKDYITEVLPEIESDRKEDGFQGEGAMPSDLNSTKRRNATRIQLNSINSKAEENGAPPAHEKVGSVAHYLSKSRF